VQPERVACVLVVPSATVIVHVAELNPERSIRNRPSEPAVPIATPSIVIVALGTAPCPSTRSCPPLSSARVTVRAAIAAGTAMNSAAALSRRTEVSLAFTQVVVRGSAACGFRLRASRFANWCSPSVQL
jgi:hypothetical protein